MPGVSGQALRLGGRTCGLLVRAAMALFLIAGLGVSALAWRLAEGPLHIPALTRLVEEALDRSGLERTVQVTDIVLAWDGFRKGGGSPLEIRATGVRVFDETGALRQELPEIGVSLAFARLLRGEIAVRDVTLRNPRIVMERGPDGSVSLAMGRIADGLPTDGQGGDVLQDLLGDAEEAGPLSALQDVVITGGNLIVLDRQLQLTWDLRDVGIRMRREGRSKAAGEGTAVLLLPDHSGQVPVRISGSANLAGKMEGHLILPALEPARIARLMPALAPLGLMQASVSLDVSGQFDTNSQEPPSLRLGLRAGPGHVSLQPGRQMAFAGIALDASGTPQDLRLDALRITLPNPSRGSRGTAPASPVISASGQAALRDGRWRGQVQIGLDRLESSELPAYWPAEVARHARAWALENLTAGVFSGGRFTLKAESADDLSGFRLTDLTGTLRVEQATIHWLRPIPPLQGVAATATFGLKEISIRAESGQQSGTGLTSPETNLRFYDLDTDNEQLELTARLRGPVADAVSVIRHPRLKLFEKRPLDLTNPGGQLDGTLRLALPLLQDIPNEAVRVSAQLKLTGLRLDDVVAGQRLERGTADLTVDTSRLRATGNAQLAGIPTRLAVDLDFRPGPASQVVERIQATAQTEISNLQRFGLDLEGLAAGPVAADVTMETRRSGDARVSVRGDLRDAEMTVTPLAWRKPPGQPATARAELRVAGDALRGLENLQVEAPELSLRGSGSFAAGNRLERLEIASASIGRTRLAGSIRPPRGTGGAWQFQVNGPVLDLAPAMEASDPPEPAGANRPSADPDSVVDARFDRVLLGEQGTLTAVRGQVRADGSGVLREARVTGRANGTGPFDVAVSPRGAGRDLRLSTEDAGALLSAFDVLRSLRGGRLSVNAHWATNSRSSPLSGTAELHDFSVVNAPGIGKLLQALTVYGVFDAVQGPGLTFSSMVAPFTLTPQSLVLRDARAFSASLGLTVQGQINRQAKTLDLNGTIVPAYALNTLLGRIPLIGRLFSPEQGGGLFAATYRVNGPLDNPNVSVNPLSMLTPGFLRNLFGGSGAPEPQPGEAAR
jgi:hypothetical protein